MIHLCVWSNLNSVTFNLWFGHSTLSNWSKITRAIASANQMQNLNPSHVSHSHFSALQLVRLLLLRDLISLLLYFRFFLFGRCHFFNGFGPSILNQNVLYLSQTRFRNDSKRDGSNNITKTSSEGHVNAYEGCCLRGASDISPKSNIRHANCWYRNLSFQF